MRRLKEYEPRVPRIIWREHIVAGMLHMVAGVPGEGKSGITINMAADLTRRKKNVIYMTSEDPTHEVVRPRADKAGADTNRIYVAGHMLLPDDIDELRGAVVKHKAAAVIIDPIQAHVSVPMGVDYQERKFAYPLAKLAEDTGVAIIVVNHILKGFSPKQHPLNAVGGASGGLRGQCRFIFIVGRHPKNDEERIMFLAKSNVLEDCPQLVFEVDSDDFTDNTGEVGTAPFFIYKGIAKESKAAIMAASTTSKDAKHAKPNKLEAAMAWLSRYLFVAPGHMANASDLREDAKHHGITNKTLRNAKERLDLETIGKGKGRGKGQEYSWKLPDELVEMLEEDDGEEEE